MVKNTTGGSKHKSQASKFQDKSKSVASKTRFIKEDGEQYAQVIKNLGNGMCHVLCQDNVTRLCIIRGKFRGRGKKDNIISQGKWIMIGIREYESVKDGKLENCDLLEVYSDLDKDRLKTQPGVDFKKFIENDCSTSDTRGGGQDNLVFSENTREEDYEKLMEQPGSTTTLQLIEEEDEEGDVDIWDI